MTFSVVVNPVETQFTAALLGEPDVRAIGPTRDAAVDALKAEVSRRVGTGELVTIEIEPFGITSLAGKYRDDPTLEEICAAIYRERDAESKE